MPGGSGRDALLPVTAVDRARADELPAVAMVWGPTGHAEDARGDNGLAADLADRQTRLLERRLPGRDDRDPLTHPGRHAVLQAVMDHQRLADGEQQRFGVE